jgi:TRAP-type C4-dicarboxylate transport system permease large subunit
VLGSVLEGIPAIVLFGPLLSPIARAVGIHEVHYAMVVILAMGIGLFAPPFGVGYYTACAIGQSGGRHAADLGIHAGTDHRNNPRGGRTLISIGFLK